MASERKLRSITIEDLPRILFRNLSGRPSPYNREGDRNFAIPLEPEMAMRMRDDGWNVKERPPREEGDEALFYISVAAKYTERSQPRVVLIGSRGQTPLDESLVQLVDTVSIAKADVIIRPYEWEMNGSTGVKAYLSSLYITVNEDDLERKYADVPMADNGEPSEEEFDANRRDVRFED